MPRREASASADEAATGTAGPTPPGRPGTSGSGPVPVWAPVATVVPGSVSGAAAGSKPVREAAVVPAPVSKPA